MRWAYLGRVDYGAALALQRRVRDAVAAGAIPDTLLLLEHPAVITLGRAANAAEHVLVSPEERQRRGVDLVQINRGGDVTYHGPGQLVGYPIRRVGRAVRAHVEGMAAAVVESLARLKIHARWRDDMPGVWTDAGKIAAVGVDARGGVAMHGLALNVSTDLRDYDMIVPCGLQAPVTSVQAQLGSAPALERLARDLAAALAQHFGSDLCEVPTSQLLPATSTMAEAEPC